jgi:hypothetical protein
VAIEAKRCREVAAAVRWVGRERLVASLIHLAATGNSDPAIMEPVTVVLFGDTIRPRISFESM